MKGAVLVATLGIFLATLGCGGGSSTNSAVTQVSLMQSLSSLSLGNTAVGTTSASQNLSLTAMDGSVTITSITIQKPFQFASVALPLTLGSNQSLTLGVTFSPTVAGLVTLTNGLSIESNSANSPNIVSLSGTGVGAAGSALAPLCGAADDGLTHLPTSWGTLTSPGEGNSYTDELAQQINPLATGCLVHQVTDATKDLPEGGGKFAPNQLYYSVEQNVWNANDKFLMLYQSGFPGATSHFFIRNVSNLSSPSMQIDPAHMPSDGVPESEPIWDATNPNLFYYTTATALKSATITGVNTLTTAVVQDFSGTSWCAGFGCSSIIIMNYGEKTYGGNIIGIIGREVGSGSQPLVEFTFNISTLAVVYSQVTPCNSVAGNLGPEPGSDCLHKFQISPSGVMAMDFNNVIPTSDQGQSLSNGSGLKPVWDNNKTAHHTLGLANDGTTEMWVAVDDPNGARANNPCNANLGKVWLNVADILAESAPPVTEHCLFSDGFLQDGHISWGMGPSQPWIAFAEADAGTKTLGAFYWNNNPSYVTPSVPCAYNNSGCITGTNGAWPYGGGELILVPSDCVGSTTGAGCTAGPSGKVAYRMLRIYNRANETFFNQPNVNCSRDGLYCAINESLAYNAAGCPASIDTAQGISCNDVYVVGPLF